MVNERKSVDTVADMNDTTWKKRKSLDNQADIITDLPIDVLYKIIECLPLKDAARTSVLSRKWHQIWTSIPSLVFDDQFFKSVLKQKHHMTLDFCSIVSKLLLQHQGPIHKFALYIPSLRYSPDVTQWMSYLSRNGIRDFSLYNMRHSSVKLSSHLYSCVGLEILKLRACNFVSLPKFRGFPKLTILELVKVYIEYTMLKDLSGSCPVLERLELTDCEGLEQRNIKIEAPKLSHLVINCAFDSLEVKNGENLLSASIVMQKKPAKACCNDLINALERSNKLEKLALGGGFCWVMFKRGHRPNIFQTLRNLELLRIFLIDLDDLLSTINCIRSFPNVERLNVSVQSSQNLNDNVLDYNPDWTLQHLRSATVRIHCASNIELMLIEYLLGCSPVLEKLSVSFITSVSQSLYSRMLMQLNQLRRISQKVVVCPEPSIIVPKKIRRAASTTSSSSSQGSSDYSSSSDSSGVDSSDFSSNSDSSEFIYSDQFMVL